MKVKPWLITIAVCLTVAGSLAGSQIFADLQGHGVYGELPTTL